MEGSRSISKLRRARGETEISRGAQYGVILRGRHTMGPGRRWVRGPVGWVGGWWSEVGEGGRRWVHEAGSAAHTATGINPRA